MPGHCKAPQHGVSARPSGRAALRGGTHFANCGARLHCPSDRRPTGHARWRRRPSRPPRSSTTATRWAPPQRAARLHRPARPTACRLARRQRCEAAGGTRSRDQSAAPTSLPGRVVGRAAGRGGGAGAATGGAATAAHPERGGALTPRCQEARRSHSTPAGRGAAQTAETAAARAPTLTRRVVGQQARAVQTAARRWRPFGLAFWRRGHGWRRARWPIASGSRAQPGGAKSPKGTRSGVSAKVVWSHRP
jgi:hypothetical protein